MEVLISVLNKTDHQSGGRIPMVAADNIHYLAGEVKTQSQVILQVGTLDSEHTQVTGADPTLYREIFQFSPLKLNFRPYDKMYVYIV